MFVLQKKVFRLEITVRDPLSMQVEYAPEDLLHQQRTLVLTKITLLRLVHDEVKHLSAIAALQCDVHVIPVLQL